MSLSISAQSNSYLAKKLGKSESNQTGASSRTQVAQNLQTSSAKTTRTLTLGSKKQSNFVAGRGNTPGAARRSLTKLQERYNHRPNQGFYNTGGNSDVQETVVIRQSSNFGNMTGMYGMSGMSGMMGMGGQMGMLNQVGTMLGMDPGTMGIINAGVSLGQQVCQITGLSGKLGSAVGSLGGNNSTVSSSVSSGANTAISNMNAASDSATLRQSISLAEEQENQLNSELNANNTSYEQKVTGLKSDIATKKTDVSNQKQAVSTAKQELANAKNSVSTLTTQVETKKGALQNAMTKQNQCSAAFAQAHANTVSAQQTADNTPKEIDGPNGTKIHNPAWDAAQSALKAAKEAEEKAKTDLDKANEAKVNADKDVKDAEKALKDAQSKLDKAQTQLETKQKAYDEAEAKLEKAQADLDKAESDLDKLKQTKQDYESLKKEITSQKTRLGKLEEQEQKEYNKNNEKVQTKSANVDERSKGIDASDGMNISEKVKQYKNERDANKINKLNDKNAVLQDNIAKTTCLKGGFDTGINGEELRTCNLPSGGQAYFIGSKEVSEEEYNNCKVKS